MSYFEVVIKMLDILDKEPLLTKTKLVRRLMKECRIGMQTAVSYVNGAVEDMFITEVKLDSVRRGPKPTGYLIKSRATERRIRKLVTGTS